MHDPYLKHVQNIWLLVYALCNKNQAFEMLQVRNQKLCKRKAGVSLAVTQNLLCFSVRCRSVLSITYNYFYTYTDTDLSNSKKNKKVIIVGFFLDVQLIST